MTFSSRLGAAIAVASVLLVCPRLACGQSAPPLSGVVVDPSGRVLDTAGVPVPGLFAGGGTACGLAGASSDGYSSGNGLLTAFGFGWIIGNRLAGRAASIVPAGIHEAGVRRRRGDVGLHDPRGGRGVRPR